MSVYLIRHAQSAFNAVHDPLKPDPMIFDAPITEFGEVQAYQARRQVEKLDIKACYCLALHKDIADGTVDFW